MTPLVTPAKAGVSPSRPRRSLTGGIPPFAGMTKRGVGESAFLNIGKTLRALPQAFSFQPVFSSRYVSAPSAALTAISASAAVVTGWAMVESTVPMKP